MFLCFPHGFFRLYLPIMKKNDPEASKSPSFCIPFHHVVFRNEMSSMAKGDGPRFAGVHHPQQSTTNMGMGRWHPGTVLLFTPSHSWEINGCE